MAEQPSLLRRLMTETWPARAAKSALEALMLPGKVYQSETPVTTGQMVGPAADLAGLVTGGSYVAPAMKDASGMGIRAYHASPHDFDKFSMKKIGTGEGTQMEGKGLYFGQSPDVADFYQRSTVKELMAREARAQQSLHPDQQRQMVEQITKIVDSEGLKAIDEYAAPPGFEKAWESAVRAVKSIGGTKGVRYEVNIGANLDDFYDLNKVLKDQPPAVYDAINRVARDPRWAMDRVPDDATGGQLRPILNNIDAVSELAKRGVPGSKYWDQFSRRDGEGTKNLVVFDDKLIDILKKYGIGGAALGGLMGMGQPAEAVQ